MKTFLIAFLMVSGTAVAKDCIKERRACVGDQVFNESASYKERLFGTITDVTKDKRFRVRYEDGSEDLEIAVLKVAKTHNCFDFELWKVCTGDTVTALVRSSEPGDYFSRWELGIKVEQIVELDGDDRRILTLVGKDEKNKLVVTRKMVIKEGLLPWGDGLMVGDTVPGTTSKVVRYIPLDPRPYQVSKGTGRPKELSENEFKVLAGARELFLQESGGDWFAGHQSYKQADLYYVYRGRFHDQCKRLFKSDSVSLENFKLEVSNGKHKTKFMITAALPLPIPFPYIRKDTTLDYKAEATCRLD